MSNAQDNLTASHAEPGSPGSSPDPDSGPVTVAHAEAWAAHVMDNGADLGGHTLLSRPPAPQGRRSLFRQ